MKGRISIGKVTCCGYGNTDPDYISIVVEDELSHINFLEVKMGLEDFTKALMGLGHISIEMELRGLERVGMKYEHKIVLIYIPNAVEVYGVSDDLIDKAVSKQEIDGWIGSRRDCKNHHNRVASGCDKNGTAFNVHFCRWVDVVEDDNGEKPALDECEDG